MLQKNLVGHIFKGNAPNSFVYAHARMNIFNFHQNFF